MFLRSSLVNLPRITHRNMVRTCTHQVTPQPIQPTTQDWRTIYKMPAASYLAKISKLKVIQAAVALVGAPVVIGLESMQMVNTQTAELYAILGTVFGMFI